MPKRLSCKSYKPGRQNMARATMDIAVAKTVHAMLMCASLRVFFLV
jgi:hypothetical protein